MKKIIPLLALAVCGCGTSPKVVDGVSISLGAYIPWDGQMYGLELIQFVSGTSTLLPTNGKHGICREHCSTNVWLWGMLESRESGKLKANLDN